MSKVSAGIGVFVRRIFKSGWSFDGISYCYSLTPKILLGERIGKVAGGLLSLPGGHMEYGESFEQTALREVEEECGKELKITFRKVRKPDGEICTINKFFPEYEKHNITLWTLCDYNSGEAKLMEVDKSKEWGWHSLEDINSATWSKEQEEWLPRWLFKEHEKQLKLSATFWTVTQYDGIFNVFANGSYKYKSEELDHAKEYVDCVVKLMEDGLL